MTDLTKTHYNLSHETRASLSCLRVYFSKLAKGTVNSGTRLGTLDLEFGAGLITKSVYTLMSE